MGHHRFVVHVRAPREQVFDLWTDLDRAHEWIEGLTRITDVTGPVTTAGTSYTAWFGRMRSPSEILQVDRPRLMTTRFGSWLLRGVQQATFEEQGDSTRLTQEFWTNGIISAVMARIFAFGSFKGSFRGELKSFARASGARSRFYSLRGRLRQVIETCGSVSVVAVLLGGGPPGSVAVTRCDSLRIRPLRRALHLTCPSWLPTPAWPTSWPDQKPVRSRA